MKDFDAETLHTNSPIIVFHERDDNLAFCPILHVLALAFADHAFESQWIQQPEDLSTFEVPSYLQGIPLSWKPSMLEVPLLRRAVHTEDGIITSPTEALQYRGIARQTLRLGQSAGFREPFHLYNLRRGAGNAVNSQSYHSNLFLHLLTVIGCRGYHYRGTQSGHGAFSV